jgi:hypothetical protein
MTHPDHADTPENRASTRRDALRTLSRAAGGIAALATLGSLAACSTSHRGRVGQPIPADPTVAPIDAGPDQGRRRAARDVNPPSQAIDRSHWASHGPRRDRADVMTTIRYMTVHHDGMTRFEATDEGSAADRLEAIRRSHVGRGWADIGYHYAVDPAGRVWAGRPLDLQGAHVRNNNPGNIGIVVLGNYELQRPSPATMNTLAALISYEMGRHRIPVRRVYTHREWNATACPGKSLQASMNRLRSDRGLA